MSPMGDAADQVHQKYEEGRKQGESFHEWLNRASDTSQIPGSESGDEQCQRAVMASREVIMEECEGENGRMVELPGNAFAFITEEMEAELPFDLDDPGAVDDVESAIQECMESTWAMEWADGVVGDDAPPEADRQARRRACEGLFE